MPRKRSAAKPPEQFRVQQGQYLVKRRGKKGLYSLRFKASWRTLRTPDPSVAETRAVEMINTTGGGCGVDPRTVSLEDAVASFIASRESEGRAPKTLSKYRSVLQGAVKSFGTKVKLIGDVTPEHVERFRSERRAEGRTEETVHDDITTLKGFFNWLVERYGLSPNPVRKVRNTEPTPRRMLSLTRGEFRQVILHVGAPADAAALMALALTGMRANALVSFLRPEHLDFRGRLIHATDAKRRPHERYVVPMHPQLRVYLQAYELAVRPPADRATYFVRRVGSRLAPMDVEDLRNVFYAACAKAGISTGRQAGLVLHSLRACFKTWAAEAGVPKVINDRWTNHRPDKNDRDVNYIIPRNQHRYMKRVVLLDDPDVDSDVDDFIE